MEFFDDFATELGLEDAQRERLAAVLGVEDPEMAEAKSLVAAAEAEIKRLTEEAKKTSKKQKGPLLARLKDLETDAALLAAQRLLKDPAGERQRRKDARLKELEATAREAVAAKDLAAAAAALADFRAQGGVATNEAGSLAAEVALLRAELAAPKREPEEQKRRMEQRKAAKQQLGFQFEPATDVEAQPARQLRLQVDPELGAGFDAQPTWYGMATWRD